MLRNGAVGEPVTGKILIVEDQEDLLELVKLTLEILPYQILMAKNGRQALQVVRTERPDLILLDIMMPGDLSGLDVCHTLKSDPLTQNIHIIILTARSREGDVLLGYQAGANQYLTKPYNPLELLAAVERALDI